MYQIEWTQSALNELTAVWMQADSRRRKEIMAAANTIDQKLQVNPDEGESRAEDERVFFALPLGVIFTVEAQRRAVRILHAWVVRSRRH